MGVGPSFTGAAPQPWMGEPERAQALLAHWQAIVQGAPGMPAAMAGPPFALPQGQASGRQGAAVGPAGSHGPGVPAAPAGPPFLAVPQPQASWGQGTRAGPAGSFGPGVPAAPAGVPGPPFLAAPQPQASWEQGTAAGPAVPMYLQGVFSVQPAEAGPGWPRGQTGGAAVAQPAHHPDVVAPAPYGGGLNHVHAAWRQLFAAGGMAAASSGLSHPAVASAGSLRATAAAPAAQRAARGVKHEGPARVGVQAPGGNAVKRPREDAGGSGAGSRGELGGGVDEGDEPFGSSGDSGEVLEEVDDDEALQGMLEGLKDADGVHEEDVAQGSLRVSLHPYQRHALGWMRKRENHGNPRAVPGGILADEQGLGKTVQAIALIVAEPPACSDAVKALDQARASQRAAAAHPESAQARAARAAGAAPQDVGSPGPGSSPRSAPDGGTAGGGQGQTVKAEVKAEGAASASRSSAEGTPPKKKAKKAAPKVYEPCGRGPSCTCAICRKAREQQAKAEEREALRLAKARGELERARQAATPAAQHPLSPLCSLGSSRSPRSVLAEPKMRLPDHISSDGLPARRTLVICPLSVAAQWVDEVRDKAPQLRVALYHGPARVRDFSPALLACHDVVVTTYSITHSECSSYPRSALFRVRWHRCILDEAQSIRNARTQAAKSVLEIRADRRWCLTGTPIVNAATDVYMLFKFLEYQPFARIEVFNRTIRNKIQTIKYRSGLRVVPNARQRAEGFCELRTAIKAITLRRVKTDLYNGQVLCSIPAKYTSVVHLLFSEEEAAIYSAYEERTQVSFNRFVREGFGANYSNILVLLMRLRQVCIHPWLAQTPGFDAEEASAEEEQQGQLPNPLDPLAHPSGLSHEAAAHLLGRLCAGDAGECPICMDAPQAPVVTACAHGPFCHECMLAVLQHQGGDVAEGRCPLCRRRLTSAELYSAAQLQPVKTPVIELDDGSDDDLDGGKQEAAGKAPADAAEEEEEPPAEQEFVSSTKLDAVVAALEQCRAEDEAAGRTALPTRTIVFSTFVKALDLLERRLEGTGIGVVRLDGGIKTIEGRSQAVRQFAHDPQARVLLASTRSAGLGLNLTCASCVIILDVWWNGASEDQAVDRTHRLGQTREVHVSKLIMTLPAPDTETVEQRIMVMQDDKRQVAQAALGTDGFTGQTRLSLDELRKLFGIRSRRAN